MFPPPTARDCPPFCSGSQGLVCFTFPWQPRLYSMLSLLKEQINEELASGRFEWHSHQFQTRLERFSNKDKQGQILSLSSWLFFAFWIIQTLRTTSSLPKCFPASLCRQLVQQEEELQGCTSAVPLLWAGSRICTHKEQPNRPTTPTSGTPQAEEPHLSQHKHTPLPQEAQNAPPSDHSC